MDTRYWGPSGWRLLHLITFTYEVARKSQVRVLFETLPYVLPCKFCRKSLAEYMEADPLEPALESQESLAKWLWRIHNAVNAKLRGQHLPTAPDPSFASVKKEYEGRIAAQCSQSEFEGWDFLFSIAENHPFSRGGRTSVPFEGCPQGDLCAAERNRWNLMRPEERMPFYTTFWEAVGPALPFPQWREVWANCKKDGSMSSRRRALRALWAIRCCIESKLELKQKDSCFAALCERLSAHRSGCGKRKRARTCRKSHTHRRPLTRNPNELVAPTTRRVRPRISAKISSAD